MAKITVVGDAIVITSEVKLEDFKLVSKYRPDALVLKGGEDGKEAVFKAGISNECGGSVSKYGISFSNVARGDGFASVTMNAKGNCEDVKEYIADGLGSVIINLNTLEKTLPAIIEEIAAEKQAVIDSITIA